MDRPSVVLVPPTPVQANVTNTYSPLSPSFIKSSLDEERTSSDTTIVTIYSMYSERPSSWTADDGKPGHGRHDSFYQGMSRSPSRTSEYYSLENSQNSHQSNRQYGNLADISKDSSAGSHENGDVLTSRGQRLPGALWDKDMDTTDDSTSSSYHHSTLAPPTISSNVTTPKSNLFDNHLKPERPPRSSPPSTHRTSINDDSVELTAASTPLPPTPDPIATPPLLTPPKTPPKVALTITNSVQSGSHTSILLTPVPSEGEDPDSFNVRNTYALLEASGVKGDGIEEGVERTRARLTAGSNAELKAAEAIADETEKKRDLLRSEVELLESLDRYGFFSVPSHDRYVSLPMSSFAKHLAPIKRAVTSSVAVAPVLQSQIPAIPSEKESSRITKWGRMLGSERRDEGGNIEVWHVKPSKVHKLRERVYKGIPDRWRNAAWTVLVRQFLMHNPHLEPYNGDDRGLYVEYREALDRPSTYDIQIDLDVPRTINGHIMFRTRYGLGQRSLFHVLHCFSVRCQECGYCQGMGPLAATLLCYYDPEKVYAIMVHLHNAYSMHSIYMPGFPGLLEAIYVQERIMEKMLPGVYAALKHHMISTTSYATKWYITLFANSVPFQTQLRLWDVFFLEGRDALVIMAVGIVWVLRDYLTSSQASFETILSLLSSFFVPQNEDSLMHWISKALSDKSLRADMQRWREEWQSLVANGNDKNALL